MIVDAWMQHPTPAFYHHPMFATLLRWTGQSAPDDVPLSATRDQYREAGIALALTCAWCGPEGWLIENEAAAAFARQSGGLLRFVASADLRRSPLDTVRELRRAVREDGALALRVLPWLWRLPPDDRRYYPLFAECCELDVPFCTQVGHTGPLAPSEPGRPIPYLDNVALEFPELRIVAGHIGFPWVNEVVSLALKYANVFVDTSAYTPKRFPPELVAYLRGPGRRKVMFGTNYPMLTPRQCLADLDGLGLDEQTRELFLAGTARAVFRL